VFTTGLENVSFNGAVQKTDLQGTVNESEYIILPLPITRDKKTLNAPLSDRSTFINNEFAKLLIGKKIFCGLKEDIISLGVNFSELNLKDYSKEEEFAIKNAVPTSEGAIELAMQEYDGTINGSNCLVAGFGRIGKILAHMLRGLGANVFVAARKPEDLNFIEILGYTPVNIYTLKDKKGFDIIFNTIPKMVFDAYTLAKIAIDSIVIDLASLPGGVDFEAASRLHIKSIQALSLPGKVAPKAAGEIIKSTVLSMIAKEES
jgi:dipicolinate synthase subunit A